MQIVFRQESENRLAISKRVCYYSQRYSKAKIGLSFVDATVLERAGWWKPLTCSKGLSPMSCCLKQ